MQRSVYTLVQTSAEAIASMLFVIYFSRNASGIGIHNQTYLNSRVKDRVLRSPTSKIIIFATKKFIFNQK
jgi:hypothetical protein